MGEAEYLDAAEVAKLLRQALKSAFPGTRFGVRTDKYAGGASIDIRWTDGPARDRVNAIAECYRGADFDGSTDTQTYRGNRDCGGRAFRSGADFVSVDRFLSTAEARRLAAEWSAETGIPVPDDFIRPDIQEDLALFRYQSMDADEGERLGHWLAEQVRSRDLA